MEDLLQPKAKNQMKLECYHHNSFRSLVQAWQFYGLIKYSSDDGLVRRWSKARKQAGKGEREDPLVSLLTTAFRRLDDFGYRNAGLRAFLETDSVKEQIRASRKEAVSLHLLTSASAENGESGTNKQ